ncbi:biotin synthase [Nitratifractor sp.]
MRTIFLCAINNVLSGSCAEDCKFCTQSARYKAKIERYSFKDPETVLSEARQAHSQGARGYCLVTAGLGLDDAKTEYIARTARLLSKALPDLRLIACNGTATAEQLRYLKAHGIQSYNHNLETSRRYYPHICTTHGWEERYATCEAVKSAGLSLCSGGIFGMGERLQDRLDLLESLAQLHPDSVALNFYLPNPALPIPKRTLGRSEALEIVRTAARKMPQLSILMVAAGREALFSGREKELFDAGANAIVLGNYLTAEGEAPDRDRRRLEELGYTVAESCHAS